MAIKQCVSLLVDLAKQGRTVVCTIHQPSSSLFHMFDHVYMVARGSCIYNGTPRQLVPFLAQVGHVCKPTHNPADFGMYRRCYIIYRLDGVIFYYCCDTVYGFIIFLADLVMGATYCHLEAL